MSNQIAALVAKLEAAKRTYYNGTNEMVLLDAEYDALEDQLRALDPGNAFFSKVGAAPTGGAWPKVKHSTPMGSLNKAQETKDLRDWVAGLSGKPSFLVSDKCDGISLNLRYEKRRLVQGLTRGDGITGEDITRNVMMMQGVVKLLPATLPDGSPTPDLVFVRGEVLVLHGDFKAHFIGDSNPRNSASGTSKRQTGADKCRYLTVKTYQYLPNGMATLPTKGDEFLALEAAGFLTPRWSVCKTLAEVEAVYAEYVKTTRASLDYDIDGLVVEINDTTAREFMGEHNGRPKGAVAFKFPHEEQPSILRNIRWQVGNSGRITPVAEFDTVNLAGAQVTQASLHTAKRVEKLKLFIGCRILVSRRNDVIPMVEANLDEGINLNDLDE